MSGRKSLGRSSSHLPKGQLHECLFCPRAFREYRDLEGHMNLHTKEQPYACPECDLHFSSRYKLYGHRQEVHMGKRWNCEICGVGFVKSVSLYKHKHREHKEWEEKRKLNTGTNLSAIVNQIVMKKEMVQVNGLGKTEDNKDEDEDNYDENGHVEEVESKESLINHKVNSTAEEMNGGVTNPMDRPVPPNHKESENEQTEVEEANRNQEEDFPQVDSRLPQSHPRKKVKKRRKKSLYFSIRPADGNKQWKCDLCGKVYVGSTDYSLRRHQRTVHCDVMLGITKKGKVQLVDVTTNPEWNCDTTAHSAAVGNLGTPKKTVRVSRTPGAPKEKRVWTCDICGRIFIRRDNYSLKRHKMTVHADITLGICQPKIMKDWKCDICGKAFRRHNDYSLRRHKRQVHKILDEVKSKISLPVPESLNPTLPTVLASVVKVEPSVTAQHQNFENITATHKTKLGEKSKKLVKDVTGKDKVGPSLTAIISNKKKGWADPRKCKKWKCHLCGCIFHGRDRAPLNRHLKSVHGENKNSLEPPNPPSRRQWECHLCGKTFVCKDRHTLFRHIRNVHKKNPNAFQDILPLPLKVDEVLIEEEETASKITPVAVASSKKYRVKTLSRLKSCRMEKKKWNCDICGKVFTCTSRYNLKRHLESVHGVFDNVQTQNLVLSNTNETADIENAEESRKEDPDSSWSLSHSQKTDSEEEEGNISTTPFPPNIITSEPPSSFEKFSNPNFFQPKKRLHFSTEKRLPKKEWDAGFFLHMNRYKPEDSCFAPSQKTGVVERAIPQERDCSLEEVVKPPGGVTPEENKETDFQCKKCGKCLSGWYSLRRHENLPNCLKLKEIMEIRQSDQIWYRCYFCNKDFGIRRKNHLVRHISAIHRYQEPDEPSKSGGRRKYSSYSCAFCPDMKSVEREDVHTHILACHEDQLDDPKVGENRKEVNVEREEVDLVSAKDDDGTMQVEGVTPTKEQKITESPTVYNGQDLENDEGIEQDEEQTNVASITEFGGHLRKVISDDENERGRSQSEDQEMVVQSNEEKEKVICKYPDTTEPENLVPFNIEVIAGPSTLDPQDDDEDTLTESSEFSSVGTEMEIIDDSQSATSPLNSEGEKPLSPAVISMSPAPVLSLEGFAHVPRASTGTIGDEIRSLSIVLPEKEPVPLRASPPPKHVSPLPLAAPIPLPPSQTKISDPGTNYEFRNSYNYCNPPPSPLSLSGDPTTSTTASTGYLNKTDNFPLSFLSHPFNHGRPPPPYHPPPPYIPPPPPPPTLPPSPPTSTAFVILNDDDDVELFKQICDLTNPGVPTAVLVTSSKFPTSSSSTSSGGSSAGSEGPSFISVSTSCSSDESSSSSVIEPRESSPPLASVSAFPPTSPSPPPSSTFPNMSSLTDDKLLMPVKYQRGSPSSSEGLLLESSGAPGASLAGIDNYEGASSGECSPSSSVRVEASLSSPSTASASLPVSPAAVSLPKSPLVPASKSLLTELQNEDMSSEEEVEELSEPPNEQRFEDSFVSSKGTKNYPTLEVSEKRLDCKEITITGKKTPPPLSIPTPSLGQMALPNISTTSPSSLSPVSSPLSTETSGALLKNDKPEKLGHKCDVPMSVSTSSSSASMPHNKSPAVKEHASVPKNDVKRQSVGGSSGGASLPSSPTQLVSSVEVACMETLALLDSLPTTSSEMENELDFQTKEWQVAQSPPQSPVVVMTTGEGEDEVNAEETEEADRASPASLHAEEYSQIVDHRVKENVNDKLEETNSRRMSKSNSIEKLSSSSSSSSYTSVSALRKDISITEENSSKKDDRIAEASKSCTIWMEGMEDSEHRPEDFVEVQMEEDVDMDGEQKEFFDEEAPPYLEAEMMYDQFGKWVAIQQVEAEEESEMPLLEPSIISIIKRNEELGSEEPAQVQSPATLSATILLSQTCDKCGRTFASFNNLKRHNRDVPHCTSVKVKSTQQQPPTELTSKLMYSTTCEKCGRSFSRHQNLIRHYKEVPHCVLLRKASAAVPKKSTTSATNVCHKRNPTYANKSIKQRHHKKVSHCCWAKKKFDDKETKTTATAAKCLKCHRTFSSRHSLKRHQRWLPNCLKQWKVQLGREKKRPSATKCLKCKWTFASPQNLRRHHREVPHCLLQSKKKPVTVQSSPQLRSPLPDDTTTCRKCGRTFVNARNLVRHHKEVPHCVSLERKRHDLVKSYHYSCPFCKHHFAHRRQHLIRHLVKKHRCQKKEVKDEQYFCGFCNNCCKSLLELEKHTLQAHLQLLRKKRK